MFSGYHHLRGIYCLPFQVRIKNSSLFLRNIGRSYPLTRLHGVIVQNRYHRENLKSQVYRFLDILTVRNEASQPPEIRNTWNRTFSPPYIFAAWSLIKRVGAYHKASRDQQALDNQRGQRQRQRLLGQAPLATEDKDADHITLVSQSEIILLWSADGNSDPRNSNAGNRLRKRSPRPLGSLLPALAALGPARSQPATEHGEPPSLTQSSPTRLELARHSSGIYVVVSPNTGTDIPHW
jgi:hypothetical protein